MSNLNSFVFSSEINWASESEKVENFEVLDGDPDTPVITRVINGYFTDGVFTPSTYGEYICTRQLVCNSTVEIPIVGTIAQVIEKHDVGIGFMVYNITKIV